jgi:hypothetical protein
MIDSTQLAHVADAIDRLTHGGTSYGDVSADYAADLLTAYPTVQSAVGSYINSVINRAEFDTVVNTAIQLDNELGSK